MNNFKNRRLFFPCVLIIFLMALGLPVMGQSPLPPTATTGAASAIATTDATLNGTVNANGETTTVFFEYGPDTGYGGTVEAVQSPVTGTSNTAVSGVIYELSPNTTYHYRVVAQNVHGTTYGADMTFTTLSPPPLVITNAASAIGVDSATLNGTVNPQDSSTTVTFQYGTDASYGNTVTADQSPLSGSFAVRVSKIITGLASNTTYHYRVVAVNAGGTTYGTDMTFTINASAPTAVTNAATAVGNDIATLNGTINAKGSLTTVTFEYGPDTSYGTTVNAIQSPLSGTIDTAVSAIIDDVVPNTTYHYRVLAQNGGGTTYGADMTFTSLPNAPTAVTNTASVVGTTGATLNGTVNANDGSTTVTFQYGTDTNYGATVTADQSPVNGSTDTAVSKSISGLTTGVTYHYRVVAVNTGGTTYGVDMIFVTGTTAPTATTNAAAGIGTTSATLNGLVNANGDSTTVTFEYGPGTSYGRTVTANQSPVTGSSNTAVSKSIADLEPATTYHYRVVAENTNGTTYGADMTFTTRAAPTVITNVATAVDASGATLNGIVNANSDSTTVTFEYGLTTAYGSTVTADQSPVTGNVNTAVSKVLTGLSANTTYHYRVKGQNVNGTSYGADMTFFTATPAAPTAATNAATLISSSGATLNGMVNANNSDTTVTFEYGTTTSYGSTMTADQNPVTGAVVTTVSKAITGLANNTTYHYRVRAVNVYGTTFGSDMTFSTGNAPAAATDPASGLGASFATLNGTVNANNFTTTVTFEYGTTTSYGSTVTADQSPVIGTDNTPVSKTITGLLPNTTYHYRVKAQGFGTTFGSDMTFTTGSGPSATTNAASSVGSTTATLNGTVNANNISTTVTFEYGLNTSYGKVVTANQNPVTGSTNSAVSYSLTSLVPNTTYHYRVVASNANDTVYGADMIFTTSGSAPTATTNAATAVSTTGATLNGTVNAKGDSTTVTFEYGLNTSYGSTVPAVQSPVTGNSNTAVSSVLTGLTGSTTYHYRVVAQNSSGTTYGADMTFFTDPSGPTATTQAASNIGNTSATLNGTVNANNNQTTVTFEFGPTTAYIRTYTADQSPVTGSSDTAVSFNVTGLTLNTTYHFRVVAQSSSGATYGADMTFTTNAPKPTVITAAASNINATSATLNGLVNANNDSTTVTFEYGTGTSYGTIVTADQSPVTGSTNTAVSANITGLVPNTTYHYRVVGQNSGGTRNGADMTFTTLPPRTPTVTTAPVTKVTFHTAKSGGNVIDEGASPVTARGVCWSTAPNPTIADNFTTNDAGPGPFNSTMNQLTEKTTYYVRAYATNSYGTAYGDEFQFTTDSKDVSVTLVKPKEGEVVSGTVNIQAVARATKGKKITKVEFYINDTKIAQHSNVPYKTDWDTTSYPDGSHTIKAVATSTGNESSEDSIIVTVNNLSTPASTITTNRDRLNFKAVPFGKKGFLFTSPQELEIRTSNGAQLEWNISTDAGWLSTLTASGKGPSVLFVYVDVKSMAAGSYSASLKITGPKTSKVMAEVAVQLIVLEENASLPPFGGIDMPMDSVTVNNDVPITGWALDDIEVTGVKIYRTPLHHEGSDHIFLGNAILLDNARPDLEENYPDFPLNYRAAWGYLLKTNSLTNQGNSTFTLYAKAEDKEGNIVTLGSQTITVDNANGVKPFGAIDILVEAVSDERSTLMNEGWTLIPQPYTIPFDGSTITVWVDSLPTGNPVYNQYNKEIAAMFPDYNNKDGAGGSFVLDTTSLTHGIHSIAWLVEDDAGNSNAVGFRYFSINNTEMPRGANPIDMTFNGYKELEDLVPQQMEPVFFKKGYKPYEEDGVLLPDVEGIGSVTIKELEPVELQLGKNIATAQGFLVTGGHLKNLPVGSTLDHKSGLFSWLPGPGHIGKYLMVFVMKDMEGQYTRTLVRITIKPKFNK